MNVSSVPLTFSLYSSLRVYNVALFVCVCALYVCGLCVSLLLLVVVCAERRLHRPMYVLLANLAASGAVGSSAVCPLVMRHLMADAPQTSLAGCLTQVFFTNVYGGCVFCILALMAYDRYVSICKPLLYGCVMTPARVALMLLAVYALLGTLSAVHVYMISSLALCTHTVDKLTCDSLVVSKLSCERSPAVGAFGLCSAVCVMLVPGLLVVLSYAQIFTVILKTCKESRTKALQTCTPHFVTFLNFSVASFFGVLYNRLHQHVPKTVNVLTSINFFVLPPLLHPVVYGIQLQEIQQSIRKMMSGKIIPA
ncbi:olfactory receptor 10J1-like [Plectropomus leopardus]|uniref:olfactory receptor 10J1-like n=1 Tax=Plectropomus leopardus TaxID=160734 RepID=UPI001C4D9692|nr:olfactory receptor 10J1-like [Plectropomus leopardus]